MSELDLKVRVVVAIMANRPWISQDTIYMKFIVYKGY